MRIPIPNLYGFAVSAGIVLTPALLQEVSRRGMDPVPFCTTVEYSTLREQRPYYVDVRENYGTLLTSFATCVGPSDFPDRFRHVPLHRFVDYILKYLQAPTEAVRTELERYQTQIETEGPSIFLLISIAHSLEGLREHGAALEVLDRALTLFPSATHIAQKADRIRNLM